MAQTKTFKCSNCGTEISVNGFALTCPNCKKPVVASIVLLVITVVIAVVIVIIAIVSINGMMHVHDKDLYGYRQATYTNYI